MAKRINAVVDSVLIEGVSSYKVKAPSGATEIQVVFDRSRFEETVRKTHSLCRVEIWSGPDYLGGLSFGDLRLDEVSSQRPGQRMLWTVGRWPLGKARNVEILIHAERQFNCRLDVDFF